MSKKSKKLKTLEPKEYMVKVMKGRGDARRAVAAKALTDALNISLTNYYPPHYDASSDVVEQRIFEMGIKLDAKDVEIFSNWLFGDLTDKEDKEYLLCELDSIINNLTREVALAIDQCMQELELLPT